MNLAHDLSLIGIVGALIMYGISVSPSLLARSWQWHAVASGVLSAVGYIMGLSLERFGERVIEWTHITISAPPAVITTFRWGAFILFNAWLIRFLVQSYRERRRANHLVGMAGETLGEYLLGTLGAFALTLLLLLGAAVCETAGKNIVSLLDLWLPHPLAVLGAVALLMTILYVLTSKVLLTAGLTFFTRHAWKMNIRTARGITQPLVAQRSGSPASPITWESVGGQGRVFLGRGPSRADIERVTGRPALEPIRVYSGMPTGSDTLHDCAERVVAELERTGAFERAVLLVATSTGSGWVDEWQVQPMEYLTEGNCATASMQYSYVPSSINYLTDLDASEEASVILFEAIRRALDERPEPRPALIVCGESLGAYASQHAFASLDEALAQIDGALWVGTPAFTPMHRELTAARHRGSPEVAPVVDNGRHVRFVNQPENLWADIYGRELGQWDFPRVIYAQHPSDPVVWWNSEMMWRKPDWLNDKAGHDVSPRMEYTRLATYIQVLVDMPVAGTAPGGHGHTYHEELIPLWEALLGLRDRVWEGVTSGIFGGNAGTPGERAGECGESAGVRRECVGAHEENTSARMAEMSARGGGRFARLDASWIGEATATIIGEAIAANIARSDRQ